jgi:hypothetical protein
MWQKMTCTVLTAGSRTPHYGSMTPSHDGSRTPGQSGAWDPSITNTPARNNDFDGYSLDEASPSPNYNPSKFSYSFPSSLYYYSSYIPLQRNTGMYFLVLQALFRLLCLDPVFLIRFCHCSQEELFIGVDALLSFPPFLCCG